MKVECVKSVWISDFIYFHFPLKCNFDVFFNIADPDLHKDPATLCYCLYKWSLHYSRVTLLVELALQHGVNYIAKVAAVGIKQHQNRPSLSKLYCQKIYKNSTVLHHPL